MVCPLLSAESDDLAVIVESRRQEDIVEYSYLF